MSNESTTFTHKDGRKESPYVGTSLHEALSKDPDWSGEEQYTERYVPEVPGRLAVPVSQTGGPRADEALADRARAEAEDGGSGDVAFTSDSAREKAEGLDLAAGEGSGKDGAYTVADVEAARAA